MGLVTIAGFAVHAPLARVPENTMKFAVGVMLTSFGIFWGAEGAGAHWPGGDAALLGDRVVDAGAGAGRGPVLRQRPDLPATDAVGGVGVGA